MKFYTSNIILFTALIVISHWSCSSIVPEKGIKPNKENVKFIGRFNFNGSPKVWAPGAYIEFWFTGSYCSIEITDEPTDNSNNYIEIIRDNLPVRRLKLNDSRNLIKLLKNGKKGLHHIIITKCTEARIGSISFNKIHCKKLLKPKKKKKILIEFIGDSMTCGNGATSKTPHDVHGAWYEQHAAYHSYGPTVARKYNADWLLSAVSGFGLTRSCCGKTSTLPEVYDFADLSFKQHKHNWQKYHPKIIFICLGQNDGYQNTRIFSYQLVKFVKRLKNGHPKANIVLLDSPMAKTKLKKHLDQCIQKTAVKLKKNFGNQIHYYLFKKRYCNGRLQHPNLHEHREIANEISNFILSNKNLQRILN